MIIIRADGNSSIGMGHIGRCISIVKALKETEADVLWIVSSDSDSDSISNNDINFIRSIYPSNVVWNEKVKEYVSHHNAVSVLVDSHNITEHELNSFNCRVPIYYLDDLNMFDYNVTGIINYNFEAVPSMYSNTNFFKRQLFIGPKYFPLNPNLSNVPKCEIKEKVQNVLITSGSTDSHNIIDAVLQGINPIEYRAVVFFVLIGKFFPEAYKNMLYEKYKKYKNINFVDWGLDVAKLYSHTDLLIAPGATMIFEALALGIPCMSFMFTENQAAQCNAMAKMQLVPYIGDFRNKTAVCFSDDFDKMLDYDYRKQAQEKALSLIDKQGARRIADILIASEV